MPLAADTKLGPYEIGVPLGTGEMGEVYRARDRILMATLRSNRLLLEGTGKGVRHVNLRSAAEVNRPGVKKLIAEAAKLNRKDPPPGMMVGMEKRNAKTKKR